MSSLSSTNSTDLAILVSDLHYQTKTPVSRADDWYEVMGNYLRALTKASKDRGNIPIICAGDVFDKWNAPVELINWIIETAPNMIAIPGQHDLPNHRYQDIEKTAYWNLVQVGKIKNLEYDTLYRVEFDCGVCLRIHGFPWKFDLKSNQLPKKDKHTIYCDIAVAHQYVWMNKSTGYLNAPQENNIHEISNKNKLSGYDFVLFGDNHIPFVTRVGECTVYNHGTFIQRSISDYKQATPGYGVIRYTPNSAHKFKLEVYPFDISKDKWAIVESDQTGNTKNNFIEYTASLQEIISKTIDFKDTINKIFDDPNIDSEVKAVIKSVIEECE